MVLHYLINASRHSHIDLTLLKSPLHLDMMRCPAQIHLQSYKYVHTWNVLCYHLQILCLIWLQVIDRILGTAQIQSYNILEYGPQKTIFLRLGWTLYWVPLLGIVHIPALPEMTYDLSEFKTLWTTHILRKFGHPLHVFNHQKMIYYFMIMFFFSIFLEW